MTDARGLQVHEGAPVSATVVPRVDLDLSRRLEWLEAHTNVAFIESRARLEPDLGAAWMQQDGAFAMFDGVDSPLTQTFGVGLADTWTASSFEPIEAFFAERDADVYHEVSPLVGPLVLEQLVSRGSVPCEFTSVLYHPLPGDAPLPVPGDLSVYRIPPDQQALWARVAAEGWSEFEALRSFMASFGPVTAGADGVHPFLVQQAERPIAAGLLSVHDGAALLAGASTVPDARRRGAQRALLRARLQHASELGCTLAMIGATPGSRSQCNAESQGFRIAYTRIKWHLRRTSHA